MAKVRQEEDEKDRQRHGDITPTSESGQRMLDRLRVLLMSSVASPLSHYLSVQHNTGREITDHKSFQEVHGLAEEEAIRAIQKELLLDDSNRALLTIEGDLERGIRGLEIPTTPITVFFGSYRWCVR